MSRADQHRLAVGLLALLGLALVAVLHAGCKDPYLAGYRTIATARATAATVEQSLTDVCHLKRVACLETHGAATPAYDACWVECRRALTAWTKYTRPAINTAITAAVGSVATAEAVKGKVDLVTIGKLLACAGVTGAAQWKHLLTVEWRAWADAAIKLVSGYVCPKEVP